MYSSPNITRGRPTTRMRTVEHVARIGDRRQAYRILVGGAGEKHTGRVRLQLH